MDFVSARSTLFSESNSRPVSRASSTATERPGSPRSLVREIDNIRSLISRASISPKPAESSISAQVFRRAPQQQVSQAQILHELDALRRRIKHESQKPVLKPEPEDIDPETETDEDEDAFHDAIDSYEDDFEIINDYSQRATQQKEQMIEDAEARVDRLTDQNEELQRSLETIKEDLRLANERTTQLKATQAHHDAAIASLKSSYAKQFHELQNGQLKDVEHERDNAQQALRNKIASIDELEKQATEREVEIKGLRKQIGEQEEESKAAHTRSQEQSRSELEHAREAGREELRDTELKAAAEGERQQGELQSELTGQAEAHAQAIEDLKQEHHQSLAASKQSSNAELERMQNEAAKAEDKLKQAYTIELEARSLSEDAELIRKVKEEHKSNTERLEQRHATELEILRNDSANSVEEAKSAHAAELETLRIANVKELDSLREQHETSTKTLQQEYDYQVEKLKNELDFTLKEAADANENKSKTLLADLDARHTEERTMLDQKMAAIVADWTSKLDDTVAEHAAQIKELERKHGEALQASEELLLKTNDEHKLALQQLAKTHEAAQRVAVTANEQRLLDASESHKLEMQELRAEQTNALNQNVEKFRQALDDVDAKNRKLNSEHTDKLDELRRIHDEELDVVRTTYTTEIEKLQAASLQVLEDASQKNIDAASALEANHQAESSTLQEQLSKSLAAKDKFERQYLESQHSYQNVQNQLEGLQTRLNEVSTAASHDAKVLENKLKLEHEAEIQALRKQWNDQSEKATEEHKSALRQASEDASASAAQKHEDTNRSLDDQSEDAQKTLKASHKIELQEVRDGHSREVAGLRSKLAIARQELDKSRQNYDSLTAMHAGEVARLFAEHEAALSALKSDNVTSVKGTQDANAILDATLNAMNPDLKHATARRDGEVVRNGLQAQVDALSIAMEQLHLTRRELEQMLQEKTHEAIQAVEERKSRERKIISLEQEMHALLTKHERTEHTLKDLQETVVEHQSLATDEANKVELELGQLRGQVKDAQNQRNAVQSDIDAKLNERGELARQNEFLTKQLASLGEQMSQPKQRKAQYTSTSVQTSPRIEVVGGSPKRSGRMRNLSMAHESNAYSTPQPASPIRSKRVSLILGPQLQPDSPATPLPKQMRQNDDRPTTPLSPEFRPKRWSMQDYVERTNAHEDELPSAITASEALLAQKLREHVGDLQHARDRLARQYQERFNSLLADRKRLEKQVTLEQATSFVKDREQLAAQFLKNERQAMSESAARQELQTAEQRLVQQYHKRIAKRKSQIRLQHADDFRTLTQDYDQHLQDMLQQQSDLENGLFDGHNGTGETPLPSPRADSPASRPEHSSPGESVPVTVVETKDSGSRLPRRVPMSGSRSSSSIPKAVSQTRSPAGLSPQPSLSRRVSGEVRVHAPIRQRSLLRMKSPPEGPASKRSVSDLCSPTGVDVDQLPSEHPDEKYLGDAATFQALGKGLKRQSASPNIKASPGVERVLSSSSDIQRTPSKGERSKRHSSGMIYNKTRADAAS